MSTAMEQVRTAYGEIADIRTALSLLGWDQQTYMPARGGDMRGQSMATLSAIHHTRMLDEALGRALAGARAAGVAGDDAAYVEELAWQRDRAAKVPTDLVREIALTEAAAFEAWVEAKGKSDFAIFRPHLEKTVELQRRLADLYGWSEHPWDALAESYERGMTAARIKPLFATLRGRTVALVKAIGASASKPDGAFMEQSWDVERQRGLCERILRECGFDMERGRLDKAPHPFCSGASPYDVRLTTRYHGGELFTAFSSTMHEMGHGLYEQGMRLEDARTPLCDAPSLGMHESQSRLWEIRVGQSLPFLRFALPLFREAFPGQLDNVTPEQFYGAVNRVEPSLIRVDADEVTYNLHIILRFELELAMMEGSLAVKDLPEAWNAKMRDLLGVVPPNDAKGCLQDVHWSGGSFGYFPTYTLGNVYNAMLMEQVEKEMPGLWQDIEAGRFAPLLGWLREKIHRVGKRRTAPGLIREITGRDPDVMPLIAYLEKKYAAIYRLG